jgi:antitoxin PrlF
LESALSIKGQATIPKAIRDHLDVKPGDRIKFFIHPDGSVVILPKIPASALKGIAARPRRRPATLQEMDDAIAATATGKQRSRK